MVSHLTEAFGRVSHLSCNTHFGVLTQFHLAPRRDDRAGTAEMGIQADFSDEEECDSENSFTDVDHEFSKGTTDAEQTSSAITQQEQSASLVNASRSAKVMARKIVELKYFFGEDLSKNELEKRKCSLTCSRSTFLFTRARKGRQLEYTILHFLLLRNDRSLYLERLPDGKHVHSCLWDWLSNT